MRKEGYFKKRQRTPDFVHNRVDVGRFINYLMTRGKKVAAEKVFYGALEEIKKTSKEEPIKVFEKALENAQPLVEVASKRVGGANNQVPREVRPERKQYLSMKWIVDAARGKKGKPMHMKLAEEIIAAANNEGEAVRKRENTHKMAEANKAFAHFAW